jgi:hypothetical protein
VTSVISAEQAKQITGGRRPLIPVEYDQALQALRECQKIDDAKYWSDKSDALAAWAKIYHSNEAEVQAKSLKLHAFRRMGELAEQIQPTKIGAQKGSQFGIGARKGAHSLLISEGLKRNESTAAIKLSRLSEEQFNKIVESPRPPSPQYAILDDTPWRNASRRLSYAICLCREVNARDLAKFLGPNDVVYARRLVQELSEWIDEFDRHLPRRSK